MNGNNSIILDKILASAPSVANTASIALRVANIVFPLVRLGNLEIDVVGATRICWINVSEGHKHTFTMMVTNSCPSTSDLNLKTINTQVRKMQTHYTIAE